MHRFSPIRAALTMITLAAALVALLGRVAYLQTYGRETTIRSAERQHTRGAARSSTRPVC
jgi:hypothetical protein